MKKLLLITFCLSFFTLAFSNKEIDKTEISNIALDKLKEFSSEDLTIDEKRELKLNQLIAHLKKGNAVELASMLSDYEATSRYQAEEIINDLNQYWGDLSKSEVLGEKEPFNKGELIFKTHLQFLPTHAGVWATYKSSDPNHKSFLRIGLLFEKGSAKIGGLVIALAPFETE